MLMEILGLIGVLLILSAYFAVQSEYLDSLSISYSLLNLVGAGLVLLSLIGSDNYAAITLEGAWLLISGYGLLRSWRRSHI
ncbi:CBU_0592 family membrane protein [Planctobacterium marinum]|uniref:CBU-0592-like domain-containing protein n=1 Tax=Planctobacterium marinum TaxID=1631968 RepID=A0AA48HEM5_9ALTE|nr:hypothetical protein MACH26_10790 [Planctobacterium marinum]